MEKMIFSNPFSSNPFSKWCMYLLSLLLLVYLITGLGCADSGSKSDEIAMTDNTDATMNNTDATMEMIRAHVDKVANKDSDIYSKLWQLEEKLSPGMSIQDMCAHCHVNRINQST